MKGIILYQSKYGSTKKYANYLKEETDFDIKETKTASLEEVKKYDTIILAGGIYASSIAGLSFLKKNIKALQDKTLIVLAVGASPYEENAMNAMRKLHFKGDLESIPLFYARGAWDEDAMSFKDRTLCKLLQKAVCKKDAKDYEPWEKALMSSMGKRSDFTSKDYLKPIIEYIGKKNEEVR